MSDQNFDQTNFIESAPLQEEVSKSKKPIKPLLPILVTVLISMFLLFMFASKNTSQKQRSRNVVDQTQATPTPAANFPDELQKAIDTLDADLKLADPQNNDLPFPPVNFSLHLVAPPVTAN